MPRVIRSLGISMYHSSGVLPIWVLPIHRGCLDLVERNDGLLEWNTGMLHQLSHLCKMHWYLDWSRIFHLCSPSLALPVVLALALALALANIEKSQEPLIYPSGPLPSGQCVYFNLYMKKQTNCSLRCKRDWQPKMDNNRAAQMDRLLGAQMDGLVTSLG